ncbi:PilZ domain-containing protein [Patescibacteria group bacterium]|nr:PilZ domain-containing protein [Desulfobacteraceae bacterium]MBU3980076.1 PilZ domain-containing protein [Pseudomonadota bacterium]MBU4000532.1 PilZ domain-containing protein [Patescibacteria group bacterium]MBU4066935.1 PilZ domain-containing protein [Pseudomonadota bacterium]MBU4100239.1 PilZ domain-containing protein [Pseudomonadota bacterium]
MEAQEQRKCERFDLNIPAKLETMVSEQTKDSEILNLLTKDICAGGAFFHTAQTLPEGTEVKIDFVLDINKLKKLTENRAYIKIKGTVLRSDSEGMAICFHKNYKITPI